MELRMNPRLPLPLPVELHSARYGTLSAVTRAASRDGMLVDIGAAALPLYARVMLRIDLGRVRYRMPATVVHNSAAGVGLLYDELDAETGAALYAALRAALQPAPSSARFPYWLRTGGTPTGADVDTFW
jgi:hypothetical protein